MSETPIRTPNFDPSAGNPFVGRRLDGDEFDRAVAVSRQHVEQTPPAQSTPRGETGGIINEPELRPSKPRRGVIIGSLIALGAAAAGGVNALNNSIERGADSPENFGDLNPDITAVQLYDGANFRHDPYKGGENNPTFSFQFKSDNGEVVVVETPSGAYESTRADDNGTWYGISEADLEAAGIEVQGNDKDGIYWVNEQRAHPVETPEQAG